MPLINAATPNSITQLEPCQIAVFALQSLQLTYKLPILTLFLMSYHNADTTIEFSTSVYPGNHLVVINYVWLWCGNPVENILALERTPWFVIGEGVYGVSAITSRLGLISRDWRE